MRPQLVIALDVPDAARIPGILRSLPAGVEYCKIGLEMFVSEGPAAFDLLKKADKRIFLDLKLHDIPRTVARAVASAARHGVALLTVHASGGRDMLRAAAEAADESGPAAPKLVAVTTLTSLNSRDLRELGVSRALDDHTLRLGAMAVSAGIDGLVCSPLEAQAFRRELGSAPLLVTPGIRPEGSDSGDQKRIATPAAAVSAGADFLVVGRPILDAPDPAAAAEAILEQMRSAYAAKGGG